MKFSDLGLAEAILRAVTNEGYTHATPIQAQAIPHALMGRDVLGSAQTGTGKTAAFALPILQRLMTAQGSAQPGRVRCLVLCPTRELATQIQDSFRTYGQNLRPRTAVIFGGTNQNPQVQALRRGLDVLIATPGRLLDLMNQGLVNLSGVEVLVLDEADRMLDMGFIHDIRRVVAKLPHNRQTMLFSATMPAEIRSLADSFLRNPATVQVAPVSSASETVEQSVYFVDRNNKVELLAHLYNQLPIARGIVFTRTKHGADRVVRRLQSHGIRAEAIHGNKTQNARERALANFRSNKTPLLVATDIASRGIDVDGVTHVVNYDLTHEPETYVHRIGRTGRAGATGTAVSFCDQEEVANLRAIEKLIRRQIPVGENHPKYGSAPKPQTQAEHVRYKPAVQHKPAKPVRHPHPVARHSHAAPASHTHDRKPRGPKPRHASSHPHPAGRPAWRKRRNSKKAARFGKFS